MTHKEKLFISEYTKCLNVKKAYVNAGYSKKSNGHWDLFHKQHIQEAISREFNKITEENNIEIDVILKKLTSIIDNETLTPIVQLGNDNEFKTTYRTASINEKIKALKILIEYAKFNDKDNELNKKIIFVHGKVLPENFEASENDIVILDDLSTGEFPC